MEAEAVKGQSGHATEPWTSGWSPVPECGRQSSLESPPAKVKGRDERHDTGSKETPAALGVQAHPPYAPASPPPPQVSRGMLRRQLQPLDFLLVA